MKKFELKDNTPINFSDLNDTENEYIIQIVKSGVKANVNFFYLIDESMKLEKKVSLVVDEGIVDAEVFLNMKAIIMRDDVVVDFKPILEIESNSVNVDHSVSIGYLDRELVWFLESRGIGQGDWRGLFGKG
jgi:Fe-S cluster assembly protein SufD